MSLEELIQVNQERQSQLDDLISAHEKLTEERFSLLMEQRALAARLEAARAEIAAQQSLIEHLETMRAELASRYSSAAFDALQAKVDNEELSAQIAAEKYAEPVSLGYRHEGLRVQASGWQFIFVLSSLATVFVWLSFRTLPWTGTDGPILKLLRVLLPATAVVVVIWIFLRAALRNRHRLWIAGDVPPSSVAFGIRVFRDCNQFFS